MLPKEKLLQYGAKRLKPEELVSLVLYTGTAQLDVFTLGRIITPVLFTQTKLEHNNIKLPKYLPNTKVAQILALHELMRRFSKRIFGGFYTPEDVYQFFMHLAYKKKEELHILFLDRELFYLDHTLLEEGQKDRIKLNEMSLYNAIRRTEAPNVVLVHNHPSGKLRPSQSDIMATIEIKQTLQKLGITLLDHIIITPTKYLSFVSNKIPPWA